MNSLLHYYILKDAVQVVDHQGRRTKRHVT